MKRPREREKKAAEGLVKNECIASCSVDSQPLCNYRTTCTIADEAQADIDLVSECECRTKWKFVAPIITKLAAAEPDDARSRIRCSPCRYLQFHEPGSEQTDRIMLSFQSQLLILARQQYFLALHLAWANSPYYGSPHFDLRLQDHIWSFIWR
jgi:hypothetical protein